jgi:hypothetical protein
MYKDKFMQCLKKNNRKIENLTQDTELDTIDLQKNNNLKGLLQFNNIDIFNKEKKVKKEKKYFSFFTFKSHFIVNKYSNLKNSFGSYSLKNLKKKKEKINHNEKKLIIKLKKKLIINKKKKRSEKKNIFLKNYFNSKRFFTFFVKQNLKNKQIIKKKENIKYLNKKKRIKKVFVKKNYNFLKIFYKVFKLEKQKTKNYNFLFKYLYNFFLRIKYFKIKKKNKFKLYFFLVKSNLNKLLFINLNSEASFYFLPKCTIKFYSFYPSIRLISFPFNYKYLSFNINQLIIDKQHLLIISINKFEIFEKWGSLLKC